MSEEREDRNLPASQRRLDRAREEGQVARSRELASLVVIGTVAGALLSTGPFFLEAGRGLVRAGLRFDAAAAQRPELALDRLATLTWSGGNSFGPLFAVLLVAGIAAPLLLGGWLWSNKAFTPDFNRMNPMSGLGRMVSSHAWIELAKATVKAAVIGIAAAWSAWHAIPAVAATATTSVGAGIQLSFQVLGSGLAALVGGLAALALADVPLAIFQHNQRLRMTKQELRDEHKESEGDPQLKGRIRQLQRANSRRRMMAAVPKATVVVTNPTHYAVAIEWKEGLRAPRVVAKGTGLVAQRIKELARASSVPLLEAPSLARALNKHVEIEGEVPAALYQAVAQVLAWVFQVRTAQSTGRPYPATPTAVPIPIGYDPLETKGNT